MLWQVCLVIACSNAPAPTGVVDGGFAAEPVPRTLAVQLDALPPHLNPVLGDIDAVGYALAQHNLLEPLVERRPGGQIRTMLAERMTVTQGGRVYRFALRKGIRFHDKTALSSRDVAFTFRQLLETPWVNTLKRTQLGRVREIRTPDPHTVEFQLSAVDTLFPALVAEVGILPAKTYAALGPGAWRQKIIVGTGPFELVQRDLSGVIFRRNEHYWGRAAKMERIVFKTIADPAQALAALSNGEVDVISRLHPEYYPQQVSTDSFRRRFAAYRIDSDNMRIMLYNVRRGPFKDRRARFAMSYLMPRQRLVKDHLRGLGKLLDGPFASGSSWRDPAMAEPRPFDKDRAERTLAGAGWEYSPRRKVRHRLGHPFRPKIIYTKGSATVVANALGESIRAVGGTPQKQPADFGYLLQQLRKGRFEIAIMGWAPTPGSDLRPWIHSEGTLNYGGYSNPYVDSLLDALSHQGDPVRRAEIGRRLHRALHDDPPLSVVYVAQQVAVANRRVKGFTDNAAWPRLSQLRFAP